MMCEEDLLVKSRLRGKWHVLHHDGCTMTLCGRQLGPHPDTVWWADEIPPRQEWCNRCWAQVDEGFERSTEWAARHSWLSDAISKVRR